MDYNDNDNEGRNLRLSGDDSSKIPSVLRPFTLPKFDFDDNLHGHLRFDSLVENEAFLGIPSQEDNQWIEDFSRAGNGIEFNPSAAESCSLHSHVNVWSEATSSESVEMLLKAVVQEETVRDGSLMQESESLSEQGTTTNEMDNQLSNDGKTADPYNENALLPSIDAVGSISVITCDSEVAGTLAENILLAQTSDFASHVVHGGGDKSDVSLATTSSDVDTKRKNSDHRETSAMVSEPDFFQATKKIHENANVESSSHKFDTPVECAEQDRNDDTSLEKDIPDSVSENLYGYDKNDTERDCPIEILSKMNSPKEEGCVEMPVFISEEASSSLVKGEDSISAVGNIDDVVIHFEHAGSFSSGTILPVQSSSIEAKELSGVSSVMVGNSNISVVGGIEELGICTNAELLEAPISKPLEGNNNSLEVRHLSITCRFLDQMDSNKVNDPIKPKESSVAGECCGKKSVTDIEEVLLDNAAIPKEGTLDYDHELSIDKAVKTLSLDPLDVVKKDIDPLRKEAEDETDIILHPVDSEVDGQESASDADVVELIDATETNLLSSQTENKDSADEILSLTDKLPKTSDSMDCSRSHEFASTVELENVSKCEVAGDIMENYQPNYLLETSNVFVPGDPCNELLEEKIEQSDNRSVVLTEGEGEVVAVAAETDKTLEEETEANAEKKNSSSPVELDDITKDTLHEASCAESFVEVDNLKSNEHENIDGVLMMSGSSRADIPAQPGNTSILNTVPLGPESAGASGKTGEQASGGHDAEGLPADIVTNLSPPNAGLGSSLEGARSPYGRKSRRPSSKSVKGSGKKTSQVGEATPVRQNEKRDNALPFSSPLGSGQLMNFYSAMKPGGHFSIPASGLPDLNTSTPPSVYFLQPFTDLQQLQLRAQIIVYGSLIQGTAPDEAYMVSAFDGGRNIWEPSWRACVDRLLIGKSKSTINELLPSRSDTKVPDHTQSQTFSESEVTPHVASRARNKSISSPVIPASATLWAMSTLSTEVPPPSTSKCALPDYPVASPLGPYQTQVMRNYATDSSRQAQAPFPVPWITPSQSSFNISTNYPVFSITTPAKLSSIKEPLPIGLGSKQVSPISTTQAPVVSDVFVGPPSRDLKKLKVSSEHSADKITTKPKKSSGPDAATQQVFVNAPSLDTNFATVVDNQPSKVAPVAGDSGQISFIPCNQAEPIHMPAVASHYSTSVTVTAPMYLPKSNTNQIFSLISPLISGDSLKKADLTVDNRAILLEGFNKVEEAKLQAQEAGANSATAISYLESVWSQIRQLSNSGLNLDSESKLASAAAAIAAAASVAKAAAAAARIAANVAVQAKQMSEEAISLSVTANNREYGSGSVLNSVNNPPSLAISAAREAARKRIEAASAATRHAANLDAILKAAELASEAVSHAGKIVSMADPFPLSQLVEAGPNEYWKDLHLESLPVAKLNAKKSSISLDDDSIFKMGDDTARAAVVNSDNDIHLVPGTLDASSAKEGSNVEVLRDFGDSKKAWFSATVLALKDGEALLCYTDVSSGSEQLKEWVSLEAKVEAKDDFIPRVRIPHRMTSVNFERTRKRQRDATKEYNWSVGDKVDAWLQNCWCEGVVAEKNKKDGTVLMINLLDQEENVPVKVWHLRPTLIWNGNQWVEWSRSQQNDTLKGDTPVPKRSKVLSNIGETKEKGKTIDPAGTARTEELTLPLSANEKLFSTGSTADEKKHTMIRGTRWGLEKEGSRVVFGVPKPGKKRKFMEVSKHYVSERSAKANEPSNSVNKSAKASTHQVSSLPGSRNNSKADKRESKPRAPFRFGKPIISNASRTSSQKDDSSASSQPNEGDDSVSDHVGKGNENETGDKTVGESSICNHEETSGEATMVFPCEDLPQLNSKKGPRSAIPERRRFPVPTGRLGKTESNESSEVAEPRRSVRRIQPTSRLLEGLQSSLITSKISASSHDKSHRGGPNKVSTKGASTGTGNRG